MIAIGGAHRGTRIANRIALFFTTDYTAVDNRRNEDDKQQSSTRVQHQELDNWQFSIDETSHTFFVIESHTVDR